MDGWIGLGGDARRAIVRARMDELEADAARDRLVWESRRRPPLGTGARAWLGTMLVNVGMRLRGDREATPHPRSARPTES